MKHLLPTCDEPTTRKIFGRFEYRPFVPQVRSIKGTYIIIRTGAVLPSVRWTYLTNYRHHPTAFAQILAKSIASVGYHGVGQMPKISRRYALIHSAWTEGYYHWLTESLPRALALKSLFADAVPMLPSPGYHVYAEALAMLGFHDVAKFPAGRNAVVRDPIITTGPAQFGTTDPSLLRQVREVVLANLDPAGSTAGRIVYVSRRKSRGRLVLNEAEVEAALSALGASCVCFEDLSFRQQVELMSRTKCLVSIKGAGLTNSMFMPAGGTVIELLPRRNGIFDYGRARMSFRHDPCYVRLAAAMQHRYGYLLCAHDAKKWQATQMSNITVDVHRLLQLVRDSGVRIPHDAGH